MKTDRNRRRAARFMLVLCMFVGLTERSEAQEAPAPRPIGGDKGVGVPESSPAPRRLTEAGERLMRLGSVSFGTTSQEIDRRRASLNQQLKDNADATPEERLQRDEQLTRRACLDAQEGQLEAAKARFREIEKRCRQRTTVTEASPDAQRDLALALRNLALLDLQIGDYPSAESGFREALHCLVSFAPTEILVLSLQNDLAGLYFATGNLNDAEAIYSRLASLFERPESSPAVYADLKHNIATIHWTAGRFDEALEALEPALKIIESQKYSTVAKAHYLETFALIRSSQGHLDEADDAYEESLRLYKTLEYLSPDARARAQNNLGVNRARREQFDSARALIQEARETRRQYFGEKHLMYADSLQDEALVMDAIGEGAAAVRQTRDVLAIIRHNLEIAARGQSERQQLEMAASFRRHLDLYLSISGRTATPPGEIYDAVLATKGAVFARQNHQRLARQNAHLQASFQELDQVSRRLAALSFAPPPSNSAQAQVWRDTLRGLTERKEEIERLVATGLNRTSTGLASDATSVPLLLAVLPPEAALVDFLEYRHHPLVHHKTPVETRLLAFVLRAGAEPVRVDLGPTADLAGEVDDWRAVILSGGDVFAGQKRLTERVWTPLKAAIGDAKTVLVSPDGPLNRLPFAALGGRAAGSFLIEDVGIVVIPTPQHLPLLLGGGPADTQVTDNAPDSLLAIGDVDFQTPAGEETAPSGSRRRRRAGDRYEWGELPATRGELLSITDSFRRADPDAVVRVLDRGGATEERVRRGAVGVRYVHFATHGFFAPPEIRSALVASRGLREGMGPADNSSGVQGFHPGLLSGLVLAGANRVPTDDEDGILTALEIAELDLTRIELAVLSACETGLGEVAGGEGTLGLQRAFHVAGAKSVVASLWKVDDEQTRQFMERLYENYWRKKMSLLDALRDSQLWMLREGSKRGDLRIKPKSENEVEPRTPPFYWAPFVLSGDWR